MKSSSGYCEADPSGVAVCSRLVRLASDLSGVMSSFEWAITGREMGKLSMRGMVKESMTGLEKVRYKDSSVFRDRTRCRKG